MTGQQSRFGWLSRNTLLLALASLFADISTEMLYPILPVFLTQTLHASGSIVGLVDGAAQATQNIVQGFSGWLSDRLQTRKSIALVGYFLAAIAKPLTGVATAWPTVLGARLLDRFGAGFRSAPRDALIASSVEEEDRGKAFGLEGAGDNLGAFVGPIVAVLLLISLQLDVRWSEGDGERRDGGQGEAFAGGEARDQLVELGAGNLVPGFEEALLGASAGDVRPVSITFPADYANEQLSGRRARFDVTVKEVKRKELPPLDDDLAIDSGFDDLEQLRGDIAEHVLAGERATVEAEFRQAALDAAVEGARVDLTPELVQARAREMWERMLQSLSHRGITRESYLRLSGNREQEVLAELEPEAELALRREAVITAVVAAQQVEPGDEDVLEALAPTAEREGADPAELLEQLRSRGRLEELREDLAARQAIDLIAERAKPIPLAQARAREQLWTPEKAEQDAERRPEGEHAPARLWTPDR